MSSRFACRFLFLATFVTCLSFVAALLFFPASHAQNPVDPWSSAQTVQPADLARELANPKSSPTVVFVGFQRLYTAGHIKGAEFHGSGGSFDGLAQLKTWAGALPRSTNLVIYCGCCPLVRCPNLRPAFSALHEMGFAKLRALILPTSFAVDWAGQGLPYDKAQ